MEAQPVLPSQFYAELNELVTDYQKEPKEAKLDQIYALIQNRFQKVDLSTEVKELNQLKVKLQDAHVEENSKIMKFIEETLNFPESKAAVGSQERQAINWEKMLPKDLWKEVFPYLEEDLLKMPLVSKGFHQLSHDSSIQALIIERYANRLSAEQLVALSKTCGSLVKKLDLTHLKNLTDAQLTSLIQAYPNLQTLDLSWCDQITDQGLALLTQLKNLQILNLTNTKITDTGLASLTQLQNLQSLDLSWCDRITDQGFALLTQLKNLQILNLANTQITDTGLASLTQLQNLQSLDLRGCMKITEQGLMSLAALKDAIKA